MKQRKKCFVIMPVSKTKSCTADEWTGKNLSGLQDFKNKVRGILKEMMDNPEKPDSPVADFLENRNISLLSQEKSANVKKLTALLSELSYDLKQIDAVVETANKNKASRLQKKGKLLTYLDMRLQNTCISLLLSTNYIALPEDILAQLQSMNSTIATTNSKLERWGLADSQRLEEQFIDFLPWWKPRMASLFTQLHKIRTDYLSDNYEELVMPPLQLGDLLDGVFDEFDAFGFSFVINFYGYDVYAP